MTFTDPAEPNSAGLGFDNESGRVSFGGKNYTIEWGERGARSGIKTLEFKLENVYSAKPQGSIRLFDKGSATEPVTFKGGPDTFARIVKGSGTVVVGSLNENTTRVIQVGESEGEHNPTITYEVGKTYVWVAKTEGMQLLQLRQPGNNNDTYWSQTVPNSPNVPENFAGTLAREVEMANQP